MKEKIGIYICQGIGETDELVGGPFVAEMQNLYPDDIDEEDINEDDRFRWYEIGWDVPISREGFKIIAGPFTVEELIALRPWSVEQ